MGFLNNISNFFNFFNREEEQLPTEDRPVIKKILNVYPCDHHNYSGPANNFISKFAATNSNRGKPREEEIDILDKIIEDDFFHPNDEITITRKEGIFPEITIEDDEIIRITNDVIKIFRNPHSIAKHLEHLEGELAKFSSDLDLELDQIEPQYLIVGQGHYMPGPPPNNYQPRKKFNKLDEILLDHEKEEGINSAGKTPRFVGIIPSNTFYNFISKGNLFDEEEQTGRLIMHGKYSHRLAFEVIRQTVKSRELDFELKSGETLTQLQFLKLINAVKIKKETSAHKKLGITTKDEVLWVTMFDTVRDIDKATGGYSSSQKNYFEKTKYNPSCCSPMVFKSILTCFGKELNLPNLRGCLLDSHYKKIEQMKICIKTQDIDYKLKDAAEDDLYTHLLISLSAANEYPAGAVYKDEYTAKQAFPFSLTENEALMQPKYEVFDNNLNKKIKIKKPKKIVPTDSSTNYYESMEDYRTYKTEQIKEQETHNPLIASEPDNKKFDLSSANNTQNQQPLNRGIMFTATTTALAAAMFLKSRNSEKNI